MFFLRDEIIAELNCPRCGEIFSDPRITPCFHTICYNCIEQLKINESEIECYFCAKRHTIPKDNGFPKNGLAANILKKKARQVYRGEKVKALEKSIDILSDTVDSLTKKITSTPDEISQHCANLRNQIDLQADTLIAELNENRLDYIEQVNDYERKLLAIDIVANPQLKELENSAAEANEYLKECRSFMNEFDSITEKESQLRMDKLERLRYKMLSNLKTLKSIQFGGECLCFKINKHPHSPPLGQLSPADTPLDLNFEGKCLKFLNGYSRAVMCLEIIDDVRIASASYDNTIKIWNISSGLCEQTILVGGRNEDEISSLRLVNKNVLAGSFVKGSISLWNIEDRRLIKQLLGHKQKVNQMLMLRNCNLASCSDDDTIIIWDVDSCEVKKTLIGHMSGVTSMTLLNDGNIASGSNDKTIILWDIDTEDIIKQFTGHSRSIVSLTLLANGCMAGCLASYSNDRTIKLWDVEIGHVLKTITTDTDEFNGLVFDLFERGNNLVGILNGNICFWDLELGMMVKCIEAHSCGVCSLLALKNGQIVTQSDNLIKIWK